MVTRAIIETYIRQLRATFEVYTRTQVCVAALRFGLVAFDDARILLVAFVSRRAALWVKNGDDYSD